MAILRTGYSFRTAVGKIDELISRIGEIGWKVAPITDRTSTFAFSRWTKAAVKAGLRPVYGVELLTVPLAGQKKPPADAWTFLALDSLKPLNAIVGLATKGRERFPALTYEQAMAATKEGLAVIVGERVLLDAIPDMGMPNLYVGLGPHIPKGLFKAASAAGARFVATSDNYYPSAEDKEFYRVTLGFHAETQTYPMHLMSDDEWRRSVDWFVPAAIAEAALQTRTELLESCKATLVKATLLRPEKPKSLRQLCFDGAKRTGVNLDNPIYRERLERELKLIAEKEFEDYFFILADIISWAKEVMVVGPARGSSCGSLVCYLLNITTIDPIPFGLIFERFIDVNRKDLPDVDVDFSDARRYRVFEHMAEKFGKEHVARLGTVGMFKSRSALKQAGAVLKVPIWMVERAAEGIVERSSGDARAMLVLEDTLKETENGRKLMAAHPEMAIAARMEGHPNNPSQHAAGVLVTEEPIADYVAIDNRTGCAMVDKKDAEAFNLLKIDALGLTQLSIFERCLEMIGVPGRSGWLEKLPLDDVAAFDVLNSGKFAGIFQYMGQALQSLVKQFKVTSLDDIIVVTALARPGPLATGGAARWLRRRNGLEPVVTAHPLLTEITRDTYGVTVYQETVMRTVREIGGMSWEDTNAIRHAMSGRMGDEFFAKYQEKFIAGAIKNGVDEPTAKIIWDDIATFGSWAFNRAHAVAYGMVSYYCCYLKAHYPLEFAAATLDAEKVPDRQIELLREMAAEGINYIPVDKDLSTARWEVAEREGRKILVGPLTSITGIGPAFMNEILDARAKGEPIRKALAVRLDKASTKIDDLFPIKSAIHRLYPDLKDAKIVTKPTLIRDVEPGRIRGDVVIIGVATKIAPGDENEQQQLLKRNGKKLTAPTAMLKMWLKDDTSDIFCKVDRFDYSRVGLPIVERGQRGKAIYALKGEVPQDFRMLKVKRAIYLGTLGESIGQGSWRPSETAKLNPGDQTFGGESD